MWYTAATVRHLDDKVHIIVGQGDINRGQIFALGPRMGLNGTPNGVFHQLG